MTYRAAIRCATPSGIEDLELAKELPIDAFSLLLRSVRYAQSTSHPLWDFAIKIAQLRTAGLSDGDLRWLACKGYLEHAREAREPAPRKRTFDHTPTLRFADRSSFVLTPSGIRFTERLLAERLAIGNEVNANLLPAQRLGASLDMGVPSWDRQRRELRIGRIVIKRYCVPAENQEVILSAFEEESWPERIDDPLSPVPGIDPKRRLHSTIQCLNRNQSARVLQFHGDGYGRGVRWELLSLDAG